MATFWAKIPYRNIVSELALLKNKIINYACMISRRTSSFDGLKCRGNPGRSDEYGTIRGLLSFLSGRYLNKAFLCISLYSLMYSPVFSCIPLYFPYSLVFSYILLYSPVFSCIPLHSPVFPCILLYSPVFPCIPLYCLVTVIPRKLYLPTLTPYVRASLTPAG